MSIANAMILLLLLGQRKDLQQVFCGQPLTWRRHSDGSSGGKRLWACRRSAFCRFITWRLSFWARPAVDAISHHGA